MGLVAPPLKLWLPEDSDDLLGMILPHLPHQRVEKVGDCDFALHPQLLTFAKSRAAVRGVLDPYASLVADNGKILILFMIGDREVLAEYPGLSLLVFRVGLTARHRLPNEHPLSFVWLTGPSFPPRERLARPVVGFCGNLDRRGHRAAVLERLSRDRRLSCQFILRDKFAGGELPPDVARREFLNNVEQSHFIVCDRGRGNWSMRLFETLSCSRIPVFVDTGWVLPPARGVSWDDTAVVGGNPDELADRIVEVWQNDDIVARQGRCRQLYDESLSPAGYMDGVFEHLTLIKTDPALRRALFRQSTAGRFRRTLRLLIHR